MAYGQCSMPYALWLMVWPMAYGLCSMAEPVALALASASQSHNAVSRKEAVTAALSSKFGFSFSLQSNLCLRSGSTEADGRRPEARGRRAAAAGHQWPAAGGRGRDRGRSDRGRAETRPSHRKTIAQKRVWSGNGEGPLRDIDKGRFLARGVRLHNHARLGGEFRFRT